VADEISNATANPTAKTPPTDRCAKDG